MEKNEISLHECKVFSALTETDWVSNKELSERLKMPFRTVSSKTKKLCELGLLDMAEVFPGHRFKKSQMASKRNKAYLSRLQNAMAVFGIRT